MDDAVSAQKEKDGLEINGRSVQLAFATDKESDGGGRRRGGGGGGKLSQFFRYIFSVF